MTYTHAHTLQRWCMACINQGSYTIWHRDCM